VRELSFAVPPSAFTVTALEDTLGFKVGGGQYPSTGCIVGKGKPLSVDSLKDILGFSLFSGVVCKSTKLTLSLPITRYISGGIGLNIRYASKIRQ
jgi:hypothetical protein